MGFLSKYHNRPGLLPHLKSGGGNPAGAGGSSLFTWGMSSLAGEVVSPQTAAQLAAVFCAIKIIAESVGMLSLDMYERKGDSIDLKADHPLQFRLRYEPNPEQTAMEWRMCMTASLCLWGNAYAKKVYRGKRLAALWFLPAQSVNVRRNSSGAIEYRYFPLDGTSSPETLNSSQMLHVRTLSWNGLEGVSPINQTRNSIGLAMALERFGSRWFANGAIPGVVLQYPGVVTDEMQRNITESWMKLHGGGDNANGVAVTEEGITVTPIGSDPQKSQAIESRKYQILDIARIYRIPPHMLMDLDRATLNNIEALSIEFVTYTLMPWLTIWEQAINRSLLEEDEKGTVSCGFDVVDLLRGDIASRYAAYAIGRQWGWLSVNDVRRIEKMNGIGPDGDIYLSPLNMIGMTPGQSPVARDSNGNVIPGVAPSPTGYGPVVRPPQKMVEIYERGFDISRRARDIAAALEKAAA